MPTLTQDTDEHQYQRLSDKLDRFLAENPNTRPCIRQYIESMMARCREQTHHEDC